MANNGMFNRRLIYVVYLFALAAYGVRSASPEDAKARQTGPTTTTAKTTKIKVTLTTGAKATQHASVTTTATSATTTTTTPPEPTTTTTASSPSTTQSATSTSNKTSFSKSNELTNQTTTTVGPTSARKPVNKTKEVCYDYVGCFSNLPPFDNAKLLLPMSPDEIGTQFSLYTRDGPFGKLTHTFIDYMNASSLEESNFTTHKPTKIVVHGFANDINTEWLHNMKDELLKKIDCNVILVTWGPGAKFPDYDQAVANTRLVAKQIKTMVFNMIAIGSTSKSIHMIGHSLGAHISGHVGQLFRKENITLDRITGLDPAEPDYKDHPKVIRLDKDDAAYVDVIHTNGAPFDLSSLQGGAGLFEPCGDVDFYVNGGKEQPDCPNQVSAAFSHFTDIFTGKVDDLATVVSCSHSRAHTVFIESINANMCQFVAYPCNGYDKFQKGECLSCGEMGCGVLGYDSFDYDATGTLFLNTRMSKPYCGYHYGVRLMVSHNSQDTTGKLTVKLNGLWNSSEWLNVTRTKDASIKAGSVLNTVAIEEQVVGRITSIKIKYDKNPGGWFGIGGGRNTVRLYQISLQSGESGKKYLFCLNSELKTGVETTLTPSETPCSDF